MEPALFLPAEHSGDSARLWQEFLDHELPALRADGWLIEQDDAFALRFVRADDVAVDIEERGNWFDLSIGVEIEGESASECVDEWQWLVFAGGEIVLRGDAVFVELGGKEYCVF